MVNKHIISIQISLVSRIVSPKTHVHPEPLGVTLLGIGSLQIELAKLRWSHTELEWVLSPATCHYKRRSHTQTHAQGGGLCEDGGTSQVMCPQAEGHQGVHLGARNHPTIGRAKEGFFLKAFRGSTALLTAWFPDSSLHNWDGVSSWLFQASQGDTLLQQL